MASDYFTRKREQSRRPSLALPHDERPKPALRLGTRKETSRKRKKFVEKKNYERDIQNFRAQKPETKPEFMMKRILMELFVYLFTYRFHISFVISTVSALIFQGYLCWADFN